MRPMQSWDNSLPDNTPVRVQVDLTRCQGYAQCVFAAPDVFRMTGMESLEFDAAPADDRIAGVRRAALACPVQAIRLGAPVRTTSSAGDGRRIVIVGGSLAGLRAAEAARAEDAATRITIVEAEPRGAYDRPNLSKGVLTGAIAPEGTELTSFGGEQIEWRLGVRVERLDRGRKSLLLSDGGECAYDRLIIASGARARAWPDPAEAALEGVHTIRSLTDALALRSALEARPARVVIIGSGFIGSEVASICRKLDLPVTVLEQGAAPLAGLGVIVGGALAQVQRAHGVDLRTNVKVRSIIGREGRVEAVALDDGETIDCELVIAALGAQRNIEWLRDAALDCGDKGVAVDAHARVLGADGEVVADVYAAGDVARWPSATLDGDMVAVEHWSNALHQGAVAGRNAARDGEELDTYDVPPAFWSNQFGKSVRSVGVPTRGEAFAVTQGGLESGRFAGVYGRSGKIVAAVTVDHSRFIDFYEGLVRTGAPFPPDFAAASGPYNRI